MSSASLRAARPWSAPPLAYLRTAQLAATSLAGDNLLFLVDYGLRFLRIAVVLSIWSLLFGERAVVGGLTLATVLAYSWLGEIFSEQLDPRTDLEVELWQGTIAKRFLRPMPIVGQLAAELVGRWSLGLVWCSLPLVLIAPWLGIDLRPAGGLAAGLGLLSLVLGIATGLALEVITAVLIVALEQSPWTITYLRSTFTGLLSGAVVPLALLPWGLGDVLAWLPFAAMAAAPLQIYLGLGEPLWPLLNQGLWVLVLWSLAGWLWRVNRERFAIYDAGD